jgi:DNA-binding transcriptional MocR family regulator
MSTKALKTIKLTRGVPPAEALPTDLVIECCEEALKKFGDVLLQYQPAFGFEPLRNALAEGAGISSEQVIVGNGSIQLLAFLVEAALSPGQTVLVERPSYDRAITTFRRAGLKVVGIPLEQDGVNLDAFQKALSSYKPRLFYVIPDFQNPTGVTTSLAKREAIAELASRYDFLIVEDIPYRRLRYVGEDVTTFREIIPERSVQLSSFSKLLCPGIRVGWLIGPAALVRRISKIAEDTYITPNMLGQGIAYEFLRRGWLAENLERLKSLYCPRLQAMLGALERFLPEGMWFRPEGGFFIGLWLPEGVRVERVAEIAGEEGLLLSRSADFFPDGDPSRFVRLPFCALSEAEIAEAISRLAWAVNRARAS